ncbi:MAG: hypothetical protein FJX56_07030 [Alphaproteobacteria bacterium]|nr:hypothetical protein [Alphaproteobacteria bacterium]
MQPITAADLEPLCQRLFDLEVPRERLKLLAEALNGVLPEIARLRELDLADVTPAVVFDPGPAAPPPRDG